MGSRSTPVRRKKAPAPRPKYKWLAGRLAQRISAGHFDKQIPKETDLADEYGVSRFTIREAMKILVARGLVYRIKGQGTFVGRERFAARWFSTATTILLAQIQGNKPGIEARGTYYGRVHAGVRQMARTLGLAVKHEKVFGYVRVPLRDYRPPIPEEVGGVILCGTFDQQYISMYSSEDIPVVVADYWVKDAQVDCVAVDIEAEAHTAINHLAERGHTTLGFVAACRMQDDVGRQIDPDAHRLLGYLRQAAEHRGLQIRAEWIVQAALSTMFEHATAQMLSLPSRPTAIVCFNDGKGLLRVLRKLNIRCPEDVSIICRSDQVDEGHPVTNLTSDPETMGQHAVRLLVERMHNRRTSTIKSAVASRLVLGKTVGPPPRMPS